MLNGSSNASLQRLITQHFPAARAAGVISGMQGLSGCSYRLTIDSVTLAARCRSAEALPGVSLARQYRALSHLPQGIAPRPIGLNRDWLLTSWLPGSVSPIITPISALARILRDLHQLPPFGWAVNLTGLLERWWLLAAPARRSQQWLRWLHRLQARGEPHPLRLAPLHMDIHAGNIISNGAHLQLIDWEYAGDGDIALELALADCGDESTNNKLVSHYASLARLNETTLSAQIRRWRPWGLVLGASWYEGRWHQTGEHQFIQLADAAWQQLRNEERNT
ncbi:thiamine kinase [Erwinia sp. HR93]|uniref:thiamine kinase n=1 Tax=Erwinia sp. HR93 TaxID=3094840 RepID=UPI002ADECFFA|nr:thiamine kinase [Erwinia sp. HR93]MEA1064830.1 thiamine kinase [Erwinia sp. HR93]